MLAEIKPNKTGHFFEDRFYFHKSDIQNWTRKDNKEPAIKIPCQIPLDGVLGNVSLKPQSTNVVIEAVCAQKQSLETAVKENVRVQETTRFHRVTGLQFSLAETISYLYLRQLKSPVNEAGYQHGHIGLGALGDEQLMGMVLLFSDFDKFSVFTGRYPNIFPKFSSDEQRQVYLETCKEKRDTALWYRNTVPQNA